MARLIEIVAHLTARRTDKETVEAADWRTFKVPEWDVDPWGLDGDVFNLRLNRVFRVEEGVSSTSVAEAEGVPTPSGWTILEVDYCARMDYGPAPESEADELTPAAPGL